MDTISILSYDRQGCEAPTSHRVLHKFVDASQEGSQLVK